MTLIVEDGTGVENANGLITVAFADEYFSTRGNTAWTGDDTVKGIGIIKATDYMELLFGSLWNGILADEATTLSFPRLYMYDRKGQIVNFTEDGIPTDIMKACAEYSVRALTTDLLADPAAGDESGNFIKYKKEVVGPISEETEFVVGSTSTKRSYPTADRLLKGWLMSQGGVIR